MHFAAGTNADESDPSYNGLVCVRALFVYFNFPTEYCTVDYGRTLILEANANANDQFLNLLGCGNLLNEVFACK